MLQMGYQCLRVSANTLYSLLQRRAIAVSPILLFHTYCNNMF